MKTPLEERIDEFMHELSDEGYTARIFVISPRVGNKVETHTTGCGLIFTQFGFVKAWILKMEEVIKRDEI